MLDAFPQAELVLPMSDVPLLPLLSYLVLLTFGALWIRFDRQTAYIFDVFGKNFHYVWFESGRRWKDIFIFGWRLIAVVLLIGGCAYSAWLLASRFSRSPGVALFVIMAGIALLLIPWMKFAYQLRFQQGLRRTAVRLTPVAQRLAGADLSDVTPAPFWTSPSCSAYYMKSLKDWRDWPILVVGVAYVGTCSSVVLFPVHLDILLAWKVTDELPDLGSLPPFHGALESGYVLRKVVPLRGVSGWSLVYTDLPPRDPLSR